MDEHSAYELSQKWFLINGKDILEYDGVSYGMVLQIPVFEYFFKESNTQSIGSGLVEHIKKCNKHWQIRFIEGCLSRSYNVATAACDVLVLFDVNNATMIGNMNLIGQQLRKVKLNTISVPVDSKIKSLIHPEIVDKIYWSALYRLKDEIMSRKVAKHLISNFNKYRPDYLSRIKCIVPLDSKEIDSFMKFIQNSVLQLTREVIALKKLLSICNPQAIITSTDTHRVSRIFLLLAKQTKIPTIVMQHGAPVWRYGYVPVVADHMMVWGDESEKWFVSKGVPSSKLQITGNPIFDKYVYSPITAPINGFRKLILLTNPICRKALEELITTFCICARSWNGQVIIKLHPSEHDIEWYHKLVKNAELKTDIITKRSMNNIGINPGDICVVANSTSGVDAVLMGAIVVNVKISDMPNPIPYEKYGVGIACQQDEMNSAIMDALKIDLAEFDFRRFRFVKNYLYELDGRSGERAAAFILSVIDAM